MHHTATNHFRVQGAILENRANLMGELLAALPTLEHVPTFDLADLIRSTRGADDPAARPLDPPHVLVAHVQVGKVTDGGKQCCRRSIARPFLICLIPGGNCIASSAP